MRTFYLMDDGATWDESGDEWDESEVFIDDELDEF